ncbi:uncharacterized protein E0L32_003238 [Thyridium curvatum]|uniref:NAD-dependent epimerase/dehydratase domain-containing protein n=1 Tax=Thyridium curvatum TaxID=1093900 RepID=A0A507BKA3_9PEZI|nr:uncharacterized protein E0L32_003238 [Thyridium curvatum]TPX17120.1 hypothetical protein E0L32_003238 [Thyridium curvatum]
MVRRVLLTGANGFIAQHILAAYLEDGHSVRGVVRSQAKADQLASIFSKYPASQLDFGVVPDITTPGAFDEVLKSSPPFDTVVHSASPFNFRKNSSNLEFLDPAVKGTTGILKSIKAHAPTVRRVVLTSSFAAIVNGGAGKTNPPKVYDESDWNPVTWEQALVSENMGLVYQASKKYAEKAAWDFVRDERPNFDLVALNPPLVLGPLYDPSAVARAADLPESVFGIYASLARPGLGPADPIVPGRVHLYVDVRDLARAHLLAAEVPAAGGRRFLLTAEQGNMTYQRAANILRERVPELAATVPRGEPDQAQPEEGSYDGSGALAREVLGLTFRAPEETIADMGRQLVAFRERAVAAGEK